MVPHFPKMVLAELRAVFGRWAGKGALALSLVIPIVAAFAMAYVKQKATESSINGMPIEQMIDASARGVLDWALTARNLFLLPALLVLSTASASSATTRSAPYSAARSPASASSWRSSARSRRCPPPPSR